MGKYLLAIRTVGCLMLSVFIMDSLEGLGIEATGFDRVFLFSGLFFLFTTPEGVS